jgi:hypothetical protein
VLLVYVQPGHQVERLPCLRVDRHDAGHDIARADRLQWGRSYFQRQPEGGSVGHLQDRLAELKAQLEAQD